MIAKIKSKDGRLYIFNTIEDMVMIVLSEEEKEAISNMGKQTKFCSFPHDMDKEKAGEFMTLNLKSERC